jgi:hypothetical protein
MSLFMLSSIVRVVAVVIGQQRSKDVDDVGLTATSDGDASARGVIINGASEEYRIEVLVLLVVVVILLVVGLGEINIQSSLEDSSSCSWTAMLDLLFPTSSSSRRVASRTFFDGEESSSGRTEEEFALVISWIIVCSKSRFLFVMMLDITKSRELVNQKGNDILPVTVKESSRKMWNVLSVVVVVVVVLYEVDKQNLDIFHLFFCSLSAFPKCSAKWRQ